MSPSPPFLRRFPSPARPPRRARRSPARLILLACLGLLTACAADIPGSRGERTIDTETFMQAIVELRTEAERRAGSTLPPQEAERMLAERDLEPGDLERFVEVHGQNVPLMNSIWTEVDRRLQEQREAEQATRDGG